MDESVLHEAGGPWVDLQPQMVAETNRDRAVMWVSWSGTVQVFARLDGALTRVRQASHRSTYLGDGWPLIVEDPFFATACGFGDATRYRSTPPLLVATVDRTADVAGLVQDAMGRARRLAAEGFNLEQVPDGHPLDPCRAMYCPRIVPERFVLDGQPPSNGSDSK